MAAANRTSSRMTARARRDQLLDVTTELVTERGFQAVSMESVARSAGISRVLIYQHFGDLPGLLEAVVEREMTRARAQISETAISDLSKGDPRKLMIESLRAYLQAVRDHPTTWRLVLMPPQGAPELLRTSIVSGRAAVLDGLAQAVRPALLHDRDASDAELTARVLSAISDEYARLVLTDPDRFPPERLLVHARRLVDKWSL